MSGPDPKVVQQFEHDTWSPCAGEYLDGFAGLADLASSMEPTIWHATSADPVIRSSWNWGNMAARGPGPSAVRPE